jgi:hypothetical protein
MGTGRASQYVNDKDFKIKTAERGVLLQQTYLHTQRVEHNYPEERGSEQKGWRTSAEVLLHQPLQCTHFIHDEDV